MEFHPEMAPKNPEGTKNAADAAVRHWSASIPTAPNGHLAEGDLKLNWLSFKIFLRFLRGESCIPSAYLHSYSGVYDVKGHRKLDEIGWKMLQFLICLCIHRSTYLLHMAIKCYTSQHNWDHPQARCLLSATPTAGRKTVLSLRKKRHLAAGAILDGPWFPVPWGSHGIPTVLKKTYFF